MPDRQLYMTISEATAAGDFRTLISIGDPAIVEAVVRLIHERLTPTPVVDFARERVKAARRRLGLEGPDIMTPEKRLLDIRELCERYGFKAWTVRTWCSQQRIPHVKLGRKVMFRVEDIETWFDGHTKPAEEVAP